MTKSFLTLANGFYVQRIGNESSASQSKDQDEDRMATLVFMRVFCALGWGFVCRLLATWVRRTDVTSYSSCDKELSYPCGWFLCTTDSERAKRAGVEDNGDGGSIG